MRKPNRVFALVTVGAFAALIAMSARLLPAQTSGPPPAPAVPPSFALVGLALNQTLRLNVVGEFSAAAFWPPRVWLRSVLPIAAEILWVRTRR